MTPEATQRRRAQSSRELLRAIADAQETYDRRYRELVGGADEHTRNQDDLATSWLTVLRGDAAKRVR